MSGEAAIDSTVPPLATATGCIPCLDGDGWWLHLRRRALCGYLGCCDSSLMPTLKEQ